ncbi:conserved hypothetical protein [Escherichia coli]|nr:conserved hypothetical protein [Escherichia coli]
MAGRRSQVKGVDKFMDEREMWQGGDKTLFSDQIVDVASPFKPF